MKRKNIKQIALLALAFPLIIIYGCLDPNMGDFDKDLIGGFTLSRESKDNVEIIDFTDSSHLGVASKVVEIEWTARYIIAKRQELKPRGDFPGDDLPVPVPGKYDYWIIDVLQTNRIGPMTKEQFTEKAGALGFATVSLQNVEKLSR